MIETPTNTNSVKKPRVLLLDLESSPSIVAAFGRFKQNIGQAAVIQEGGYLLTACAKWLGEPEVIKMKATTADAMEGSDGAICTDLYDLIEQSDAVIAHNLNGFDLPLLKARLMINGFPALKKVRCIDTLNIARQMKFNSSKLDSLCSQLDIGRKLETTGMELWLRCMQGDPVALQEMLDYNEQDVILLEELYLMLRPYDTKHPNLAAMYNDDLVRCNICGSTDLTKTENTLYTNVSAFDEHICNSCGGRLRSRVNKLDKVKRKSLLSN